MNKQDRKERKIRREMEQCWDQHARQTGVDQPRTDHRKPARRNWQPRAASTHRVVKSSDAAFSRAKAREQRRNVRDRRGQVIATLASA